MNLFYISNNEKLKLEVASFIDKWNDESSFFESKTSGSTGVPKTIRIEKRFARASANATIDFLKLKNEDNVLLCLSIQTIGGKMLVVRSIINSMNLFVIDASSNPLKETEIEFDFIAIAPIQLTTILEETPDKLKSVRKIILGGGQIHEDTINLLKRNKITVYQTFGMTETISHIALRKVGFEEDDYYTTVKGITINEIQGQLIVNAPHLGLDNLLTNDWVEVIDFNHFKWLGRFDHVINSGGIKIQIDELELLLQKKINNRLFIYPKKDKLLGEKVVLIVEGAFQDKLTKKEFFTFIDNKFQIPKEVAFLEEFIMTNSHKINRFANFESIHELAFKQIL